MYQIVKQTVVFSWDFNQVLNDTILNDIASCDKIIFSNYEDLDTCLITDNKFDNEYGKKRKKSKFNQRLDNLPYSIKDLILGCSFNQRLDNLPPRIQNLTLGYRFNQCLDNLPSSIINLTLDETFNQPLDNLPYTINKITFKSYGHHNIKFNQEIKKIPQNLTLIDISRIQNKSHLKKEFGKFNVEIIE